MRLFIILSVLLYTVCPLVKSIKCYCTDDHCVPYGICESETCLVGIVRNTNSVIRTCGSEFIGCKMDIGRWSNLCACDKPLCNTFAYLRSHMRKPETPLNDGDSLVFSRIESINDEYSRNQGLNHKQSMQTSFLTLLLVGVPLVVGTATVVVVAFNYYCHLC